MKNSKPDIREQTQEMLAAFLKTAGQPAYRATQILEWLWKKSARSFEEMTNLSKDLRALLETTFSFPVLQIKTRLTSEDGTIKLAFVLHDGNLIEGVLIPTEDRMTACVSSQVGCSLSCKFCATGFMDRKRNLTPGEIYDQVVLLNQIARETYNQPLTNIVFMGMGEPLLNYANVLKGIEKITSPDGLGISPKRITVSTAGIAKMINKLADDKVRFNLALSLHAPDDKKRNQIMPINEQNNLAALVEALNYFYQQTGNKLTFEYILFAGFNDTPEDARQLVALCRKVPAIVNIIEYNTVTGVDFRKPEAARIEQFRAFLEKNRVTAKVRKSRGKDIDAACGQLANKFK